MCLIISVIHEHSSRVPQALIKSIDSLPSGPTALIRFRIWARGQVDITGLIKRLTEALCHALCDIVLEYRLLTTPICEAPIGVELEEELKACHQSDIVSPPRPVIGQSTLLYSSAMGSAC